MLDDSDRLLATIEQVLRTGRMGRGEPLAESRRPSTWRRWSSDCVARARTLHNLSPEALSLSTRRPGDHHGRCGRGAGGGFEPHR